MAFAPLLPDQWKVVSGLTSSTWRVTAPVSDPVCRMFSTLPPFVNMGRGAMFIVPTGGSCTPARQGGEMSDAFGLWSGYDDTLTSVLTLSTFSR